MEHLESISYNQGPQTYKNNRNSEKWPIWLIPRVCLPGSGLSYNKGISLYNGAPPGTHSWRQSSLPMNSMAQSILLPYYILYPIFENKGLIFTVLITVTAHTVGILKLSDE